MDGQVSGLGLCTPFSLNTSSAHGVMLSCDWTDIVKRTTAGRVVSPRSILVYYGFSSKDVMRVGKQNIVYSKHHTPHCWLPAKVMYSANLTKRHSWLTRSTPNFFCCGAFNYIHNLVTISHNCSILPVRLSFVLYIHAIHTSAIPDCRANISLMSYRSTYCVPAKIQRVATSSFVAMQLASNAVDMIFVGHCLASYTHVPGRRKAMWWWPGFPRSP